MPTRKLYVERLPGFRLPISTLLWIAVMLVISFLIMILSPAGPAPESSPFITLGASVYPARKYGYLLFLAGISCLAVLASNSAGKVLSNPRSRLVPAIVVGSVLLSGLYGLTQNLSALETVLTLAALCVLARPKVFCASWARKLLSCAFIALTIFEIVPAVHGVCDLSKLGKYPDLVSVAETHSAFILTGPAHRLASGARIFLDVEPSYGLIFQTILGAFEKRLGILDWGAVIRATSLAQCAFLVLASLTYFKFARRSLPLCFLATVLLLPSFAPFGASLLFPHTTALRFFGFLLATIYLVFASGRLGEPFRSSAAGLVSGLSLLANLETGISVLAGMLAYTIAVNPRGCRIGNAAPLAGFGCGLILAVLFFEICFALAWGYFPRWEGWLHHLQTILFAVSSGKTSAGELTFEPIVFFMVCHSAFVFIDYWCSRGAGNSRAVRLSIASMLLVWFVYYFNRPTAHHMAPYMFLYFFLLIDLVRVIVERWGLCSAAIKTVMITVVFYVSIVSLNGYSGIWFKFTNNYLWDVQSKYSYRLVSGMYFPEEWVPEIVSRAQRIKRESKLGPVYYLTMNPVLIPSISKVQSNIPYSEIYFSLYPLDAPEKLVDYLRLHAVKVFVDSPDLKLGGEARSKLCLNAIRSLLNRKFVHESTEDGWQIWIKRVSAKQ